MDLYNSAERCNINIFSRRGYEIDSSKHMFKNNHDSHRDSRIQNENGAAIFI